MQHFTVRAEHILGFVAEEAPLGSTEVAVKAKCERITSDEKSFHIWMHQISSIFLSKIPVAPEQIHKLLIILHENDVADVYINDFPEVITAKVKEPVKVGSLVAVNNISEVHALSFPGITTSKHDAVVYCFRREWRFSLYFDFTREIDDKKMGAKLGALIKEAIRHSALLAVNAKMHDPVFEEADAVLFTEGKTDVKHIQAATNRLGSPKKLALWVEESGMTAGSDDLIKMCRHYARVPQAKKMIFMFDRDEERVLRKLNEKTVPGRPYQSWGNNVYSFAIPIPRGRAEETHSICIELFYADSDLKKSDGQGRRLYLSNEFNENSGAHFVEGVYWRKGQKRKVSVIDSEVFNIKGESVALSKDGFAELVLKGQGEFANVDYSAFSAIFEIIDAIVET